MTTGEELTLEAVAQRVAEIVKMDAHGGDPEGAHAEQDNLYEDVLRAVAAYHRDSQLMAVEALRVAESNGERWFA
jgi:hypothetical protein